MERIIVKNNSPLKRISTSEVEKEMLNNGIIIVYNDEDVVGHLRFMHTEGKWEIELLEDMEMYDTLSEVLDEYPDYIFKFIN